MENYCKDKNLAVPSKEIVGKILKNKYGYQEGREASGERGTVWKGVRLVEKYREKDRSVMPQSLKRLN